MYASLAELIGGWRKNVYAGGRQAVPGKVGRALFPLILLSAPVIGLAPVIALVLALIGVLSTAWLVWSSIAVAVALIFWIAVYISMRESPLYVVLYPLGMLMLLYIFTAAIVRGSRVEWKERSYLSS
jgi:hypothetical protein